MRDKAQQWHEGGWALLRGFGEGSIFFTPVLLIQDQLIVVAIREQRMTIGDFPGFNDILLSHRMQQTLVRELNSSWRAAVSNVAGVYLITDTSTGKHYVEKFYSKKWV